MTETASPNATVTPQLGPTLASAGIPSFADMMSTPADPTGGALPFGFGDDPASLEAYLDPLDYFGPGQDLSALVNLPDLSGPSAQTTVPNVPTVGSMPPSAATTAYNPVAVALSAQQKAFGFSSAGNYAEARAVAYDAAQEITTALADLEDPTPAEVKNYTAAIKSLSDAGLTASSLSVAENREKRDNTTLYLGLGTLIFSYWQSQQQMSYQERQREKSLEDQKRFMDIAHRQNIEMVGLQQEGALAQIGARADAERALAGPPLRPGKQTARLN
jgi:hypothetical protein